MNLEVKQDSSWQFLESSFPCLPQWQAAYLERVDKGFERMRKSRVILAGLARNIAKTAPKTIKRIEQLGLFFLDYRVLIYENDSLDETVKYLKDWQRLNPKVNLVSESLGDPVHQSDRSSFRAARMAHYRNRCKEEVCNRFTGFDWVILIDTDLPGGFSINGVANSFGHENWSFIGSNGIQFKRHGIFPNTPLQYDSWAFRLDENFTPLSHPEVAKKRFKRGEPLVPVTSCFGGLGIYPMSVFAKGKYSSEDVDHVTFNRSLQRQNLEGFYLNPSQITVYGRKSRKHDKFFRRLPILNRKWLG